MLVNFIGVYVYMYKYNHFILLRLCPQLKNEWNKWKNYFSEMKGDVDMSPHRGGDSNLKVGVHAVAKAFVIIAH